MKASWILAAVVAAAAAGGADAAPGGFGPAVGPGGAPGGGVRGPAGRPGRVAVASRRHGARVHGGYGYGGYGYGYGYGVPALAGYGGFYGDGYGYGDRLPYEFRFRAPEPPPAVPAVAGIPAPAVQPPAIYVIGGPEREAGRRSSGRAGEDARVIRVR